LQGEPSKAAAALAEGLEKNPDNVDLCLVMAEVLVAQRRTAELDALFQKLAQRQPKSGAVAAAVGDFYMMHGERERAGAAFRRGMAANAEDLTLKQRMVEWHIVGGHFKEAEALNREILRRKPKDLTAKLAHGRILLATGKADEAIAELRGQIREAPDTWQAHYYLAVAMREDPTRLAQAKDEFQQALRIAPDNAKVRESLTELCLQMRELPLARETAERAVQLQPGRAQARILLGTVLLAERNLAGAREQLTVAAKLAPGDPRVRRGNFILPVELERDVHVFRRIGCVPAAMDVGDLRSAVPRRSGERERVHLGLPAAEHRGRDLHVPLW
jgi:predicted Zn-dependent protease